MNSYPGCDWWYGFLRRHPQILLGYCVSACSQQRPQVFGMKIMKFFLKKIVPDQNWNADETGPFFNTHSIPVSVCGWIEEVISIIL